MSQKKFVHDEIFLVTIDMAKTNPVRYCSCPDRSEAKPFEFHNNRAGLTKLWDCVIKTKLAKGLRGIVIGFETTGAYTFLLLICNFVSKDSLFFSRCCRGSFSYPFLPALLKSSASIDMQDFIR